jgi:23S rRNA pseudouridine2605 synthase
MATERLQKILAKTGLASRRKAEELISEGNVTINGKVAKVGDKAELGKDAIKVKGKLIQGAEAKVYLAFYKPKGVISMLVDPENRPNLSDYLSKVHARVFPVGRLDFTSEGLIFLTNDGDFAEKLQKRDDIPRVYQVKLRGKMTDELIKRIERGAKIDHKVIRPHSVRLTREMESKSTIEIVMLGSGAVDIRAMLETKGFLVERIARTAIGHITLRGLEPGHYRLMKASQVEAIIEKPELGMVRLEREIENSKPAGQRNVHAKKVRPDADLTPFETKAEDSATESETDSDDETSGEAPLTSVTTRIPGTSNVVIRRPGGKAPAAPAARAASAAPGSSDTKRPSAFDRAPRAGVSAPRASDAPVSRDGFKRGPRAGGFGGGGERSEPGAFGRAPRRDERSGFGAGPKRDDRGPRRDDRGPRPAGAGFGGPRRDDRGPRPAGAGFGGPRRDDRGPRPAGTGFGGPRRDDRGPRPAGAGFGGPRRDDRGPRPAGAGFGGPRRDDRGPRPAGAGFGGPRRDDRGPRPAGAGFAAKRGPRPEGGAAPGGFKRGPRSSAGPSTGGSSESRGGPAGRTGFKPRRK